MSRIFVTGIGLISPAGNGADKVLDAMDAGTHFFTHRIYTDPARQDELQPWPVAPIAWGEIAWPQGEHWANSRKYANYAGLAAVAVARDAVGGRVLEDPALALRSGIVIAVGSTNGAELGESIQKIAVLHETDDRPLATLMYDESPDFSYVRGIPSQVGQFVAMATGFRGSNVVVYGESSAGGFSALSFAARMIESGELDRVMVVGIGPTQPIASLAALETQETIATEAVPGRGPFDANRGGILLGQGAVAIVVESEAARLPDTEALAELLACETLSAARRADAFDAVVRNVLDGRGTRPDTWWASSAGSVASDREECGIVAPHLAGTPVSSSRGTIGGTLECGGLIDIALAIESLARKRLPPIGLLQDPDPAIAGELDLVVGESRPIPDADTAFITAIGYGPNSTAGAALLTRRFA